MPTKKVHAKVAAKKKAVAKKPVSCCSESADCPCCGCSCKGRGATHAMLAMVFGGLTVALSFSLLQNFL
jgi:hypothetical protein